jgi:hypothetical protein
LARKYGQRPGAAAFAAAWAQLSACEQQRLIREVQDALRALRPGDADHGQGDGATAARGRHIRFTGGQVQVLNSARRARSDAAWAALAESGRQIEQQRKGHR